MGMRGQEEEQEEEQRDEKERMKELKRMVQKTNIGACMKQI